MEDGIIITATELKQKKKMSVGDAIIAATALYYNYPFFTNNESDFEHIEDLMIIKMSDIL